MNLWTSFNLAALAQNNLISLCCTACPVYNVNCTHCSWWFMLRMADLPEWSWLVTAPGSIELETPHVGSCRTSACDSVPAVTSYQGSSWLNQQTVQDFFQLTPKTSGSTGNTKSYTVNTSYSMQWAFNLCITFPAPQERIRCEAPIIISLMLCHADNSIEQLVVLISLPCIHHSAC